jgi:putative glycosyltransferase (TIGR04348 family)
MVFLPHAKILAMTRPRLCIVSPALADANNGNWRTASRWGRYLSALAQVDITSSWQGQPVDALIALHARRSAASIARFAAACPGQPLVVVLTGTDLYHDLPAADEDAVRSLQCASAVVVLQTEALHALPGTARAKAHVIVQSAPRRVCRDKALRSVDMVAVGHLRAEKDPITLMHAARLLPPGSPLRVLHIGGALDEALGRAAEVTMAACSRYRWLGPLPALTARRWIARSRALVHMSRLEGGANVVVEAVRSEVPVLASRIDGNVGLLGRAYEGYFAPGDAAGLAALMQRFVDDARFAARLAAYCSALAPRFAPEAEAAAVRELVGGLLTHPASLSADSSRIAVCR